MRVRSKSRTTLRLAALIAALGIGMPSLADMADEETLKIGYLFKIPQFVDWPNEAAAESGQPFRICVVSGEEINAIAASLGKKQIKQRAIVVTDARRIASLEDCKVLYLGSSEGWRVQSILAQIKGHAVLTVSDAQDFAPQGGVIGLVKQDDRLKFEINLAAANQAGLRIAAQLAQLATKTYK
jgi:hypothetical protein